MKKIVTTLCIAILLTSCNSTKTATTETAVAETATPAPVKTTLLGKEDRSALEKAPFDAWFNRNYAKYTVKEEPLAAITNGLKGVTVTTFMGTWCGDSKRETPRMYKILDAAAYDADDVTLITVDRSKQNPKEYTSGQNIIRVPTFIFTKDGEEIGRIVERPVVSLEEDMLKILKGEPYKHAYEF